MPAKKRSTSANLAEDDSGSPELEDPDDPPGSQTQATTPEKPSGQETEENHVSQSPSRSETAQEGAPTLERSVRIRSGVGVYVGALGCIPLVSPLFVVCRSPYASGVRDLRARAGFSHARER